MLKLPYELFVAFRYFKSKKRHRAISLNSYISIGGVSLGVATLIATLAIMTGFSQDLRDKILGTNAHIIVQDVRGDIKDFDNVVRKIEHIPHVVAAAPFIQSEVMISAHRLTTGAVIRGIDPAREDKVTNLARSMKIGTLTRLNGGIKIGKKTYPAVLIGSEMAKYLGLFVGDTINIISPRGMIGPFGMVPTFKKFVVAGIFDSGMYEYDSKLIYISLNEAQNFFKLGGVVNAIAVKVDNIFTARKIARIIETQLGTTFFARDWMEMNRNLFSALRLEKMVMFIILVLIIIVATFNIIGTLTMLIIEKSKDIAILKAMGATSKGIFKIFITQGLIIGLIGTIIGIPLGYGVSLLIQEFYTLPADVYYISHIPSKIEYNDVILVALSAIIISLIATIYPSWQASKLEPAEALRYE